MVTAWCNPVPAGLSLQAAQCAKHGPCGVLSSSSPPWSEIKVHAESLAEEVAERELNPALSDPKTCVPCHSLTLVFLQLEKKKKKGIVLVPTASCKWNLFNSLVYLRLPSRSGWMFQGIRASKARPQQEAMRENTAEALMMLVQYQQQLLLSPQTFHQPLCCVLSNGHVRSSQTPREMAAIVPILQMRKTEAPEFQ